MNAQGQEGFWNSKTRSIPEHQQLTKTHIFPLFTTSLRLKGPYLVELRVAKSYEVQIPAESQQPEPSEPYLEVRG